MTANKPYRIRVRTKDGKPRDQSELNKLKSNALGMPHLDIVRTDVPTEFIICAPRDQHIEQARSKLDAVGLEEIPSGDTSIPESAPRESRKTRSAQPGTNVRRSASRRTGTGSGEAIEKADLTRKPYGFVSLPQDFTFAQPVWHDGTCSGDKLSGEVRFELRALTPLLVGWERGIAGEGQADWPVPEDLDGVGPLVHGKPVLCPLRAPWGKRPVVIPGDSLKGLLRHELGALLGAPMERVAERSYSYRPNALYPASKNGRRLVPRLARVPSGKDAVELRRLDVQHEVHEVRVPKRLELLSLNLTYVKSNQNPPKSDYYRFGDPSGALYRGGLGAGEQLNSKRFVHQSLAAHPNRATETVEVPPVVQEGYLATLRHLVDIEHGHFSDRHPDVPEVVKGTEARNRILKAASEEVFQPGDFVWVEWDLEKQQIVSLGWHYYYRWAYTDTVRRRRRAGGQLEERKGLFPLPEELQRDTEGAPKALSPVRRLLGYTGDNEGSAGIGEGDYAQLMGRISINAALEVVGEHEGDDERFLPPVFLRELGMPRPSAVEFYLQQPYHPNCRPSDRATLVTYGDAAAYDKSGELAGRKFYLDRPDAYKGNPWEDRSEKNQKNQRSTLVLNASRPGRRFRFTLRFRDLEPVELAAVLVALCPHQFREALGGRHPQGYCSKLGYARPLGWGSVRIEAKALFFLTSACEGPELTRVDNVVNWVRCHHQSTENEEEWLNIHRRHHPNAGGVSKG